MRLVYCFALTVGLLNGWSWRDEVAKEDHHHALTQEEIGSVHFSTTCLKTVENGFNRAVALLHSFQYEQARQAFSEISNQDPQCAMAKWGVAMSHYHGLWDNGDLAAGRVALHQAQEIVAANPKTSAREAAYIDALAEIYREDGKPALPHSQPFEQKIGDLHPPYPHHTHAAISHPLPP